MPRNGYLDYPYIPNRQHKSPAGRPTPHRYLHRIAYTEAMVGMNDDIPALLFYGAPFALLRDVCQHLFKIMNGRVSNIIIGHDHACRYKNGKCYWRVVVSIHGLDQQFISLKEFVLLVIARMKVICNCTIRHYRLETFINL